MMNDSIQILLVEDSSSDAELTMRVLRKNFQLENLFHLDDGEAALQYLFGTGRFSGRNTELKPKVILLDLKMPRVNGIEVLERLKADESTRHIPVVIFTSSKESSDVEKCYAIGANSYVVKPMEYENFSNAVSEVGNYWVSINHG